MDSAGFSTQVSDKCPAGTEDRDPRGPPVLEGLGHEQVEGGSPSACPGAAITIARWLSTTEMSSFTLQEARSSVSKYGQDWILLEAVKKPLSLASLLVSSSGCQQSMAFLDL